MKYYLRQINTAWTTPKAGLLSPLSDPGCLSCKGFEETADDLVSKGHRYAKTPATFSTVKAYDGAPEGRQFVRVVGTQHKVDVVDAAGKVVSTDPQEPVAVNAMTIWKEGRWLIYDLG